jgi:superoxide oxidase
MNNNTASTTKFNPALVLLHWFMLLLIATVYCLMEFRDIFPKNSDPRELMKSLHFMLGISVLVLVILRLCVRNLTAIPAITPEPKPFEKILAKSMHVALYIFMIYMPIMGWLTVNAHGRAVPFFGLELPMLIAENKDLGELLGEAHEIGSTIGYILIALHAAAGLYHHYKKKDNTLLRMSFSKKS